MNEKALENALSNLGLEGMPHECFQKCLRCGFMLMEHAMNTDGELVSPKDDGSCVADFPYEHDYDADGQPEHRGV